MRVGKNHRRRATPREANRRPGIRGLTVLTAVLALTALTACSGEPSRDVDRADSGELPTFYPQACTAGVEPAPADASAGPPAEGSTAARLAARGRIIVGVSSDTLGLSARQNASGEIEGFEVDLAREVARHATGDPANIELKVVENQSVDAALTAGHVDMVINHVPMSCQYQEQVVLSEPYLDSPLATVQRADDEASIVCGDEEQTLAMAEGGTKVMAPSPGGCLVWLQQGKVDRIVGARASMAGLVQQDPQTVLASADGDVQLSVAVARDRADLAGYVGAVTNDWRETGGWQQSWDQWLAPLEAGATGGNQP